MLTVTSPAPDRALLTLAELRRAVGITDTSADGDLQDIGDEVTGTITSWCKVAKSGATPPTLRQESLVETFTEKREPAALMGALPGYMTILRKNHREELILSRRPVVSIASVVEGGTTLQTSDYEVDASAGLLHRIRDGNYGRWGSGAITVTYTAGYAIVPDNLKTAARRLARLYWFSRNRDPLIRQQSIPDVVDTTYWVGTLGDGALPPDIEELLGEFKNNGVF